MYKKNTKNVAANNRRKASFFNPLRFCHLFFFFLTRSWDSFFYSSGIQGVFLSYSLSLMYNQKPHLQGSHTVWHTYRIQYFFPELDLNRSLPARTNQPCHDNFAVLCRNPDLNSTALRHPSLLSLHPFLPLLPPFRPYVCFPALLSPVSFLGKSPRNAAHVF